VNRSHFKKIFMDTLPVLTGYLFLGAGFGILLSEAGYGVGWALLMSVVVFAGSGQYLLVGLIASGAGLLTTALYTLLVNARHLFYGISLVDTYRNAGAKKLYMIFGLTDETYSLVTQARLPEGMKKSSYCFWVTLFNHIYWIAGCTLGNVAGMLLPVNFEGVSFVLTALFVTMFVEQWLSSKDHWPALIGVMSTAVCLVCFGADWFLIPSMAAIAGLLTFRGRGQTA